MEEKTLIFKVLNKNAKIPEYATCGSACFDLHACMPEVVASYPVNPGESIKISTGLAFEIPEGHVLLVFSRSGHGFRKGLRLVNSVGVIDSDYRGEVLVGIHNDSSAVQYVENGERIAQAMLVPIPHVVLAQRVELSETERGANGFGSTGTH